MNTPVPVWLERKLEDASIKQHLLNTVLSESNEPTVFGKIKTLYLFLTRKCNLGCSHCYINGVGSSPNDSDFGFLTVKNIIEQALPLGLEKIKLSGGEPLAHKEVFEILTYVNGLGLKEVVLETNATLLNDDKISILKDIKNLTVYVSIDNSKASQHDVFRKKEGAFERTKDALMALSANGINTVVTTTAYVGNFTEILTIMNLVFSWGVNKHRTLLNIHPLGNAKSNSNNTLCLSECISLINSIVNSNYFKTGMAYLTLPPALMPLENLNAIHACGWGDKVIGVLSNGKVSMCSASYDDNAMLAGDIYQDSLLDIWTNSSFFKELRQIRQGKVKGICSNCIFYNSCGGVCKMSSYSHYGEKDAPYPLCQEFYNNGLFPKYAIKDTCIDSTYKPDTIPFER